MRALRRCARKVNHFRECPIVFARFKTVRTNQLGILFIIAQKAVGDSGSAAYNVIFED